MKFNDLTAKQKELLNAFIQGETLEIKNVNHEWVPLKEPYFSLTNLGILHIRIKPKEPVVTYKYWPVFTDGSHSCLIYSSIREIWLASADHLIHSFLVKTYYDGIFVKAEIIPKLELSLKGLV